MATSRATTGNLGVFYIGTVASPFSYNAVLEVKSFKLNLMNVPQVPTSHLLSPSATEEFIPGMIKPGTAAITGNLIGDTSQTSITALAQAQTLIFWKATGKVDNLGKTYTANGIGYIAKWETGPFEQNKAIEYSLEVQITGVYSEAVA